MRIDLEKPLDAAVVGPLYLIWEEAGRQLP